MSTARPSVTKRQREQKKRERQAQKAERRAERKNAPPATDDETPQEYEAPKD